MTTIRTTLILTFFGLFGLSACRDKPTCLDCEEAADADDNDDDGIPLPDLPCGGADLMTDNLNCGACGHECVLSYPGSEYEAGSCNAGVCGPGGWTNCFPGDETAPWQTCSDLCIALGETCVANGCAGVTGMMFGVLFGVGCNAYDYTPVAILSGGCDQPIPWMSTEEKPRNVQCCCAYQ